MLSPPINRTNRNWGLPNHLDPLWRSLCLLGVVGIVILSGCARWSQETSSEPKAILPPPKMSPDSVIVESVVVRFPQEQSDVFESIWSTVDESVLDIQLRRRMADNGLRCGVLIGDLPTAVKKRLDELSQVGEVSALEQTGLAADIDSRANRFQCRAGRRKELAVRRELLGPQVVVSSRDGRMEGATYEQAVMLFDLRVFPHGDGQATLQLIPEIQHGEARKSFVSNDFGVRPEMSRERKVWEQLTLSTKMSPGQVLVLCSDGAPAAPNLGRAFFITHTAEQTKERAMLLVRLSVTQLDDLFAPEEIEAAKIIAER
jgi:hypothetical protein